MIPDYREFTIGSIFRGTDQSPTPSALLTPNWRGCFFEGMAGLGLWLETRRRSGLRAGAVGRQHRGSAARLARATARRHRARAHRHRLADRPRSRDGAGVGAVAAGCGPARRYRGGGNDRGYSRDRDRARHHLRQSGRVCRADAAGRAAGHPPVLHYVAHTGSRELFRLAVLSLALGVAYGATELFGVSFALGAFFAGMVLAESELSHRAAEESLPLRDAFAVLFFVSVGMLFDPTILVREPGPVIATLSI